MSQHSTVASWAEEVPGAPYPMTIAGLLALPEDARWTYELVEGRLVRRSAGDAMASKVASRLLPALEAFVSSRNLGRISGPGEVFNLTPPGSSVGTGLAPDVAFVRAQRIPPRKSANPKRALRLAPDLVAEVTLRSQSRSELLDKVKMYLAAGARLVWIVWPVLRRVDVWLPPIPIAGQPATQLGPGDMLDGLNVIPGFTAPVSDLFA
jgi:Uma2 family endonuclease